MKSTEITVTSQWNNSSCSISFAELSLVFLYAIYGSQFTVVILVNWSFSVSFHVRVFHSLSRLYTSTNSNTSIMKEKRKKNSLHHRLSHCARRYLKTKRTAFFARTTYQMTEEKKNTSMICRIRRATKKKKRNHWPKAKHYLIRCYYPIAQIISSVRWRKCKQMLKLQQLNIVGFPPLVFHKIYVSFV